MQFSMLGPVRVADGNRPVELGGPKQRAVLALLLVQANRVMSSDRLIDELWGGEPPDAARQSLQSYVSRLRKALADDDASLIVSEAPGYVLRVEPEDVDALRFEALLGEARVLMDTNPDGAASRLREGLGLWRGRPLEDVEDEAPLLGEEATRLEEVRLSAVEQRIAADLAVGRHGDLVAELEGLTREFPYRERLWAHLMVALYRSERQADALRAYQEARRLLGDELGIEPSPDLRRLEEQILLQDPALDLAAAAPGPGIRNPYKGLHAFNEADAADFYGRDSLVAHLVAALSGDSRLLAVVGPSGSGKSSVVRAGVIPALRKGALPGSDHWLIARMLPGGHPFAELEAALLRSTLDPPDSLEDQLSDHSVGLLRAVLRVLPDEESQLVLLIDQFEELFTLVDDEEERRRFLENLMTALADPRSRLRVVLTLRADFYDRPLLYSGFGELFTANQVNVLPLSSEELEAAAAQPAAEVGVAIEPALLTELVLDVAAQPGALPLFQYTLTELFEQLEGTTLTLDGYQAVGRLHGALSGRAEDLYGELDDVEQEAARQLALRLVALSAEGEETRRRVRAADLTDLDVDPVAMQTVIERFGRYRLLTFDRDPVTGDPTVEVAHEALLRQWDRYREWIEESRNHLLRHATFTVARDEWLRADRDPDYLLTGSRLDQYQRWAAVTTIQLTVGERRFLDASLRRREEEQAAEEARRTEEVVLRRRARTRLWGLAAAVAALAVVAGVLLVSALGSGGPKVAMVFEGRDAGDFGALFAAGLDRADREFSFQSEEVVPVASAFDEFQHLSETGWELIIGEGLYRSEVVAVAREFPDTRYVIVDQFVEEPNVTSLLFAQEEGSYLVGAAAALTSDTGTIGYVGGAAFPFIENFRAGYEAGARAVDPDVEVLATFVTGDADFNKAFARPDLGKAAALKLYERGADVVFHAAGFSGLGVFEAAKEQSEARRTHLWAIGVDADQYHTVDPSLRPYILTSMVKKVDEAVYQTIRDFFAGEMPTMRVFTLADNGVGFSTSGGFLDDAVIDKLNEFEARIVAGEIVVPAEPSGPTIPPPSQAVTVAGSVTFDGDECRYDGPSTLEEGDVLGIDVANGHPRQVFFVITKVNEGTTFATLEREAATVPWSVGPENFKLLGAAGGPVRGGGESSIVTEVSAGTYAVACGTSAEDGDRYVPAALLTVEGD